LKSSYYQIPVEEASKDLTTISTPFGHYRFTHMPFGLKNTPMVCQDFIERVFPAKMRAFVRVYIDDILVFSRNPEEHILHIERLLKALNNAGLVINSGKCEWAREEVTLLGFIFIARFPPERRRCRKNISSPVPKKPTPSAGTPGNTEFLPTFCAEVF
jgi:hypothetical protein